LSFPAFLQAIQAPGLRRVAQHWNAARGPKRMPAWSDINPKDIAAELPMVWAYRYDAATGEFIGRLSGERIAEIFGRNLRGHSMREIYPARDYDRLLARSKRLIAEPAFYHAVGVVFQHIDRFGKGERIMMPLADDGVTGDGIFGATLYLAQPGAPEDDSGETESWFGA